MAKTPVKTPAPKTAAPRQPVRQSITFELVAKLAPPESKAERIVASYGLEPVNYHGIREKTEEHVVRMTNELTDNLNERAMAIFLQRVVGSFVGAAYGAGQFYRNKQSDALSYNTRLTNDDRDEDRDGVAGFEGKAERAMVFAAEMGLQAYALTAAAEGAVHAYAHVTGDDWKPYDAPTPPASTVQRRSTDEMRAALAD